MEYSLARLRRSFATCLTIVVAATALPVAGEAPSAGGTSEGHTAVEAVEWEAVFRRTEGWTGADAVYSVDLGDGRTLWLFGDTWIGRIANGRHAPGSHLINNSIAVHSTPTCRSGKTPRAQSGSPRRSASQPRPKHVAFYWGPKAPDGKPTAWIVPDPNRIAPDPIEAKAADDKRDVSKSWYWPGDGVVVPTPRDGSIASRNRRHVVPSGKREGARLVLFLHRIGRTPQPRGVWSFMSVGGAVGIVENVRDAPERWRVVQHENPHVVGKAEAERTPGVFEVSWGAAVYLEPGGGDLPRGDTAQALAGCSDPARVQSARDDNAGASSSGHDDAREEAGCRFLYIYGVREASKWNKQLLLARVKPEAVCRFDRWRFYSGGGQWTSDALRAAPVAEHLVNELSVERVLVGGRPRLVMVHSEAMLGTHVMIRMADRPEGPWSEPRIVYDVPGVRRNNAYFTYAAKGHAHLSRPGELLVSYVINSTDFGVMVNDPEIYRPRFIRVRLE